MHISGNDVNIYLYIYIWFFFPQFRLHCIFYFDVIVVQLLSSVVSDSLWLHRLKHARLLCPSPSPGVCSNSCPLSWWCHSSISSSVSLFSSCLQSFPVSGSFPVIQLFTTGSQSTGASASASVLPMNIHSWCRLGLTSLIALQSKGPLRVIPSTTVRSHEFFGAQPFLLSSSYSHTQLLEKP